MQIMLRTLIQKHLHLLKWPRRQKRPRVTRFRFRARANRTQNNELPARPVPQLGRRVLAGQLRKHRWQQMASSRASASAMTGKPVCCLQCRKSIGPTAGMEKEINPLHDEWLGRVCYPITITAASVQMKIYKH